jgi:hypothetical protein
MMRISNEPEFEAWLVTQGEAISKAMASFGYTGADGASPSPADCVATARELVAQALGRGDLFIMASGIAVNLFPRDDFDTYGCVLSFCPVAFDLQMSYGE